MESGISGGILCFYLWRCPPLGNSGDCVFCGTRCRTWVLQKWNSGPSMYEQFEDEYDSHWVKFKANTRCLQEGFIAASRFRHSLSTHPPTMGRTEYSEKLRFLQNMLTYLRFGRERKRLGRQVVTTKNDLTRAFPPEIIQVIWAHMLNRTLRPVYLGPTPRRENISLRQTLFDQWDCKDYGEKPKSSNNYQPARRVSPKNFHAHLPRRWAGNLRGAKK